MNMKKRAREGFEDDATRQLIEFWQKAENEQKRLISNFDYINWLEEFTNTYGNFCDNDWLYFPDDISKSNLENVNKLDLFFEAIMSYCNKYMIDTSAKLPRFDEIRIKYNGVGYVISLVAMQGGYIRVSREEINEDFIEFESIVAGEIPVGFNEKVQMIEKLEALVCELKRKRVSQEKIMNIIKKYY